MGFSSAVVVPDLHKDNFCICEIKSQLEWV